MTEVSTLGPINPASIAEGENEKRAPWIIRKLVGSMTGRIVMSSYESLRAAGTTVVCLSPWGDSSPLLLPCIRFRDLVVHTVIAATGGMAAVAAPVMAPAADLAVSSFGDSILLEIGMHAGFKVATEGLDELVIDEPIHKLSGTHARVLETTGVKVMTITLKYFHTVEDANLGFYRSSLHRDSSLFANVKDYLAIEKGWFSPYLFASGRRPIIPRTMKPDVVFCHGPFLSGDYKIGEALLRESAHTITLCQAPAHDSDPHQFESHSNLSIPDIKNLNLPDIKNMFARSRTPSPEPSLAPVPVPPSPRRLVILLLGIKPHRKLWTTSQRPSESVIQYILLNGCPSIVVPVKPGAPLLSWDTLTLKEFWKAELPQDDEDSGPIYEHFEGMVKVLCEYLDMCIDWDRLRPVKEEADQNLDDNGKRTVVKNAMQLLVAAAVRSKESKPVQKEVDEDRCGIVMFRIP